MTTLTTPTLQVIGSRSVQDAVGNSRAECAEVVRETYIAHSRGETVNPHSSFLKFPEQPRNRIIALPASVRGADPATGLKWISSWPGNPDGGIPRASALLILNDEQTGYPYAVLESSIISATRTAASAAVGAEELVGERRAAQVSLIGTGLIARHVLLFLRDLNWAVGKVVAYDTVPEHAEDFTRWMAREWPGTPAEVSDSKEQAIRGGDLVCFATVSSTPHVHERQWFDHDPVVLHLSLRDLGPEVVGDAFNITDDIDHAVREGTSLELAARADTNFRVDGTIGDMLQGKVAVQQGKPRIYSPFGLGSLDIALAQWVYNRRPTSTVVNDFFVEVGC